MTNSMIPYSFTPGTKAKAAEVNANFAALAEIIEQNKNTASGDIDEINEILETKADKTELINEHTVAEASTDLNDYKTKGSYIFTSLYKPSNIPKGTAGMLVVTGVEEDSIKQIWFCNDSNPEIFTRNYESSKWSSWRSVNGIVSKTNYGYLKLQNGLIIQWGGQTGSGVTYPIAYTSLACPIFSKQGYGSKYERSDTGFTGQSLTGFNVGSAGVFSHMNWIAIGY